MDNDSSLIALAELHFGAAIGKRDVMVANIGWGTGLGMIINGKLYRGSSGYAGEFSHIPLSKTIIYVPVASVAAWRWKPLYW